MFIIKSKSEEDAEERNRFHADDFTSVDCGGSREDCLLYLVSSKGINSKYI